MHIRRSSYRNRYPIDHRYEFYNWPQKITISCPNCKLRSHFNAEKTNGFKQISPSVYSVSKLPVPSKINGKGACLSCGFIFKSIKWPQDCFYKIEIKGGLAWAWNEQFLKILSDRVSGKNFPDEHFVRINPYSLYYLARLPKFVLLKTNRNKLNKEINHYLNSL